MRKALSFVSYFCVPVFACIAFVNLFPVSAQSPKTATGNDSLAARLQRFEDKDEIQALLLDYGRYLDARDFAGYASLFAKDGQWIGGFGTVAAADIKPSWKRRWARRTPRKTITCSRTS